MPLYLVAFGSPTHKRFQDLLPHFERQPWNKQTLSLRDAFGSFTNRNRKSGFIVVNLQRLCMMDSVLAV